LICNSNGEKRTAYLPQKGKHLFSRLAIEAQRLRTNHVYIIEKQPKMFSHPGSVGRGKENPNQKTFSTCPWSLGVVLKTGPAKKESCKFGFNLLKNRKLHN